MQINKMFQDFNTTFGIKEADFTPTQLDATYSLIADELLELFDEIYNDVDGDTLIPVPAFDKYNTAKELVDILYITMQRMTTHGLDVEACIREVHESNMSKLVAPVDIEEELEVALKRYPFAIAIELTNGMYVLRDSKTNKVIKPVGYKAADMTKVVK